MYIKIIISLLLLEIIDVSYTTTSRANELIRNICDTLHDDDNAQLDEDRQWEIICQELFDSKDDDIHKREQHDITNEEGEAEISPKQQMPKAAIRIGSGVRAGSGVRTGSVIRTGTSIRTGSGSGSRSSSSVTRYQNIRTGQTYSRPTGWQWSRSRLIFLPIATRFFHRSRSSSNRYTTPASSSVTYYYCTSDADSSEEIQCNSAYGDTQCCEDEETNEAFCCGGDIPDDLLQDPNRASQTIARIFYTLAVLALCMHLFMRRFYR